MLSRISVNGPDTVQMLKITSEHCILCCNNVQQVSTDFFNCCFNPFFTGFFAILHSWLNAFAEMLRFADRLFYKDWWNSSSFANYYRTWNVVVHDWLYSYVYKEMYNVSTRYCMKIAANFMQSFHLSYKYFIT